MIIMEIWVPEAVIVFFLALPLFRPFVKMLMPLDGLAWLPLIALGITIGIFPAYGFRPECLPILLFAFVYTAARLFRPKDSFRDRGPVATMFAFILLGAATFSMFAFSSKVTAQQLAEAAASEALETPETKTVQELKIIDWITGPAGIYNRDYFLRVYGDVVMKPLVFVVPPEIGSTASVDLVCMEIQKKDFTVVTYSFKDHDPLKRPDFLPAKQLTYWHIFKKAAERASVNEQGKALEADRRAEIEFLLSRLPAALGNSRDGNLPPVLLAGYGAGGSALAYLAGESGFISQHDNILGVAAIEGHLWSSYLPEARTTSEIALPQWASGIVNHLNSMLNDFLPQRVSREGPLPNAGGLPVLYLVSGKALDTQSQRPYQAVFDCMRFSSGPIALAAIEGAGPLDYQDFPFTHPIYSFLLPGRKDAVKSENPISDTAAIIANYASFLLGQNVSRETFALSGSLYVESKGIPGFGLE